jgi:hypothetical protein
MYFGSLERGCHLCHVRARITRHLRSTFIGAVKDQLAALALWVHTMDTDPSRVYELPPAVTPARCGVAV